MSPLIKRSLHWAGSALAVTGIVFVGLRLQQYSAELDFERFGVTTWAFVLLMAVIYGVANLIVALSWKRLLEFFGGSVTRRWAVTCYGLSQLAKYVPGNIFHLAGRQALGMAIGVPAWALVKSTVWELGLMASAGALFGLLAIPWLLPDFSQGLSLAAGLLALGIAALLLKRIMGRAVTEAFLGYALFLALSGSLFVALVALLDAGSGSIAWLPLGGAFILAWLIGLVTPGAPAGVGVRELVLLYLLKGAISEADVVAAVILGRVVTVFGDVTFFAIASVLRMTGDDAKQSGTRGD